MQSYIIITIIFITITLIVGVIVIMIILPKPCWLKQTWPVHLLAPNVLIRSQLM